MIVKEYGYPLKTVVTQVVATYADFHVYEMKTVQSNLSVSA